MVKRLTHSSTEEAFIKAISSAYSLAPAIAAAKILGFVVTPTTPEWAIRDGRECASVPVILALDKSSSQMEVPNCAISLTLMQAQP